MDSSLALAATPADTTAKENCFDKLVTEIEPRSKALFDNNQVIKQIFCYSVYSVEVSREDVDQDLFCFLEDEMKISKALSLCCNINTSEIRLLQTRLLLFATKIRGAQNFMFCDRAYHRTIRPPFYREKHLVYSEKTLFAAQLLSNHIDINNLYLTDSKLNHDAIQLIATFNALRFMIRHKAHMCALKHPYYSLIEIALQFEHTWVCFEKRLFCLIDCRNQKYKINPKLRSITVISRHVLRGLVENKVFWQEQIREFDPSLFVIFPNFLVIHLHTAEYRRMDKYASGVVSAELKNKIKNISNEKLELLIKKILELEDPNINNDTELMGIYKDINSISFSLISGNQEFRKIMELILDY